MRIRETTLLELAEIIIRQQILEKLTDESMIFALEDLIKYRVQELGLGESTISYTDEENAFTCELSGTDFYVLKHDSLDKAIEYELENIGEIHIIHNMSVYETELRKSLSEHNRIH